MNSSIDQIGALIPARLNSERLPNKALMEICGRPIIHHLLDRVTACKHLTPKNTVVCVTQEKSDDPLVESVGAYGAQIFRGSTNDIIDRFNAAMDHFNFDAVVQIDGDDPLSATEYMNLTMDKLLSEPSVDIVTCKGLPLGTAVKSFTRHAMKRVLKHYYSGQNDTGFMYFFTKSGLCKQLDIEPISPDHIFDAARLTLDYEQDFTMFSALLKDIYKPNQLLGLTQVLRYLRKHPKVVAINSGLDEDYWYRTREKVDLKFKDENGTLQRITI